MRKAFVVLALVLLPGTAFALDIKGKKGLSAGIADDNGQVSLIRGRERGALILDFTFNLFSRDLEEDNPAINDDERTFQESSFFSVGPRLRRFGRPEEKLSPYLDVFAHFVRSKSAFSQTNQTTGIGSAQDQLSMGGEVGLGMGAEFETGWAGVNVAIHTDFLTLQYLSVTQKTNQSGTTNDQDFRGTAWDVNATIQPSLFARIYF